jgi:redox-sensitive bicupin YhaK (pirin superfamily)
LAALLVRGSAEVNGQVLESGDAAAFAPNETIELNGRSASEVLLFDLA